MVFATLRARADQYPYQSPCPTGQDGSARCREACFACLRPIFEGDRQAAAWYGCLHQMRKMPSASHRERESLVQERLRIENRIEALLFTQGIRKGPSLRSWERDLSVLRTGDGREMPRHLRAELDRLRRRLVMILELIREVEAERDQAWPRPSRKIRPVARSPLCRCIRGLGRELCRRAHTRGVLSVIRQPPTDRKLRRHHADALPERRDGPRSAH